jgi:hypothetical protein
VPEGTAEDQALGECGGRLGPRRARQKKAPRLLGLWLRLEAEAAARVEAEAETKAAASAEAQAEAEAAAEAEALIHGGNHALGGCGRRPCPRARRKALYSVYGAGAVPDGHGEDHAHYGGRGRRLAADRGTAPGAVARLRPRLWLRRAGRTWGVRNSCQVGFARENVQWPPRPKQEIAGLENIFLG